MRRWIRSTVGVATVVGALSVLGQTAQARQLSVDMRLTPMFERPNDTPSLCPMLALSLTDHWWVGAGYELLQDYDAIVWTSETFGRKPVNLSGIRAGTWYRGGASRQGMSFSVGGVLTFANRAFSLGASPAGLDNRTYFVDFGADLTFGRTWDVFRLELFATPAWSYGRVSSPAIHKDERYSAFTYRVGAALAVVLDL
jgi:hypothetical protein